MTKIPKIIFTKQLRGSYFNHVGRIDLNARQFVNMIKIEEYDILYSDLEPTPPHHKTSNFLYLIKEGMILNALKQEIEYLEDFFKIKGYNCEDFFQYLICEYYEIDNHDKYIEFNESNFGSSKNDYELFKEAKKYSFSDKKEYLEAKRYGITDINEYKKWKSTDFGSYNDFVKARKGKFTSRKELLDAQKYNIDTFEEYQDFINKGFKEIERKINEVENDAKRAFDKRNYKEFIRLMYLCIEKVVEILYSRVIGEPTPAENDLKTSNMIEKIQAALGKDFKIIDDFHKWRLTRNDIVHENLDVDTKKAQEAQLFYQETKEKLMNEYYNFKFQS